MINQAKAPCTYFSSLPHASASTCTASSAFPFSLTLAQRLHNAALKFISIQKTFFSFVKKILFFCYIFLLIKLYLYCYLCLSLDTYFSKKISEHCSKIQFNYFLFNSIQFNSKKLKLYQKYYQEDLNVTSFINCLLTHVHLPSSGLSNIPAPALLSMA